ncbi:tyrosine-type recombinase/integrase [Oceanobacillus kimchii]|uniref:tyrosine-type recombinase/integrase n=1 Tax=Oceanobacillus kimchii TaxID=746691 RepID=UPI0021A8FCB8|nr:site-specific integrase [Oceanobacillus kimchii]MCT1577315.1 tyrosine-type recombinase/integrase [Oceanobacillus kimchii]MCT2136921.1 tyrosine-type recombinase/integrase [Oceanobacillus kimchii]
MSIRKLNDGRFQADVSLGINPLTNKRRRKKKTFKHKKDAEDWISKTKQLYKSQQVIGERQLDFITLKDLYLEESKLHHKPNYYKIQEYTINKHITPAFKNSIIKKITPTEIREYQSKLIDTGLSYKSINNIMIILKKFFDKAIEEQVIPANPCKSIKNLSLDKKQMKFWTPEQFKLFIQLIDKDEYMFKVFYTFAYFTGMRCGEILALTWNDIDKFRKEVNIYKSLTYINKEIIITKPKTKNSIRRISINSKLIELLQDWKREQQDLFSKYKMKHSNEIHIFQYKDQAPTKDIFSRKIRTICERDDKVEAIRLHDFRHSHVALLIHQREDYTTIKERLGHASIKTTIDVYGHLFPNKQRETADRLDELF